jgi:hypothetical protein
MLFSSPLFGHGPSRLLALVRSARRAVEDRKRRFHEDRVLQPAWRVQLGLTHARRLCRGDQKVREIRRLLDAQGYSRSDEQIEFHNQQLVALLPQIYGDEWSHESERVLKEFGIKKIEKR